MSESQHAQPPLYKQHSLSSDMYRDEAWLRRRQNSKNRRSKSVTDDDLDELKTYLEVDVKEKGKVVAVNEEVNVKEKGKDVAVNEEEDERKGKGKLKLCIDGLIKMHIEGNVSDVTELVRKLNM
ncbi:hypothetical protein IFM89_005843 [Coptis chinensis]|uniref:Uncharacterized protein n=1 Tax=Coptis chinensis TaxID=261450 RepID=A0A835HL09_9MAGN|nr:hypothetical protein IFM89_005843 [Coptis chinensis]